MKRIPKQGYTAESKEQAVKRADEVGSIARAAEELGLRAKIEKASLKPGDLLFPNRLHDSPHATVRDEPNLFRGKGNLGDTPILKHISVNRADEAVAEMRAFFDDYTYDQTNGEYQQVGGFWLSVSLWGPRGEDAARLLRRGARVQVEGVLKQFESPEGPPRQGARLPVTADDVTLCLGWAAGVEYKPKRKHAESSSEADCRRHLNLSGFLIRFALRSASHNRQHTSPVVPYPRLNLGDSRLRFNTSEVLLVPRQAWSCRWPRCRREFRTRHGEMISAR